MLGRESVAHVTGGAHFSRGENPGRARRQFLGPTGARPGARCRPRRRLRRTRHTNAPRGEHGRVGDHPPLVCRVLTDAQWGRDVLNGSAG